MALKDPSPVSHVLLELVARSHDCPSKVKSVCHFEDELQNHNNLTVCLSCSLVCCAGS